MSRHLGAVGSSPASAQAARRRLPGSAAGSRRPPQRVQNISTMGAQFLADDSDLVGASFQQGRDERLRVGAVPVDERQRGVQSLRAGPRGIARDGIESAARPSAETGRARGRSRAHGRSRRHGAVRPVPGPGRLVAPRRADDEQGGDEQCPCAPGEMMPRRGGHHGAFALAPARRPGIHA